MPKYWHGWIEMNHDLVELDLLLLLVCAVLFYPAVFEMCDLCTDNHSGTHIDKQPYFVAWQARHLCRPLETSFLWKTLHKVLLHQNKS